MLDNGASSFPGSKEVFLERLGYGRQKLWEFIDSLTEDEMTARRDSAGWAIKDHLIHLALYEKGMTALLTYQPRWPVMGVDEQIAFNAEGFDELNAVLFQQNKDLSVSEVLSILRHEQKALSDTINQKSYDDLLKTYSHYQPDEPGEDSGRPILDWVIGNTYEHYEEHLPWMKVILNNQQP
jgi:uncharacterized damage-inducible protein DinB